MTKKSTTNEDNNHLQYKNDQITLKMWREILLSGVMQGSDQWYWTRNLRGTLYGRTVFKHLMTFLSDEQNFDVMLDLVRECPGIMHPESVALNDKSRFLNEVSFYFKEDADRSTCSHSTTKDSPIDVLESLPDSMESYGAGEALEAVSEMSVESLAKLHSLDVIEKSNGRELRIIGRKPSKGSDLLDPSASSMIDELDSNGVSFVGIDLGDDVDPGVNVDGNSITGNVDDNGDLAGLDTVVLSDEELGKGAGSPFSGVDDVDASNVDDDGVSDMDGGLIDGLRQKIGEIIQGDGDDAHGLSVPRNDTNNGNGNDGMGKIFGVPGFDGFSGGADSEFVVEVSGSGDRRRPTLQQMEFVEDNYPVLLMRDIALHSMITGDEVLVDVINSDWIPDPRQIDSDNGVSTVSSLDCGWLLSNSERIIGEFLRVVYRSMAYGFYKGMTRKSPESFSDECWDALWEEASLDHEIVLKIIDKTFPWGFEPGRRTIKMVESSVPEAYDMAQMRWKSGVNGDSEDVSVVDALKDLLTSLLVQTNRHDFDLHARCLNESVTFFEMSTYSVVLDARTVLGEEIDPLVPLPGTAFGLKTSDLVAEFERIITRLVSQDEIRLQYLGRRKSDGRLAFVYVDETGKTIVPEAAVKISM